MGSLSKDYGMYLFFLVEPPYCENDHMLLYLETLNPKPCDGSARPSAMEAVPTLVVLKIIALSGHRLYYSTQYLGVPKGDSNFGN